MRKIAFILLLLLVWQQTPAGEFLRLPILIEHYHRHRASAKISFLDFLQEHYSKNHKDADQAEDQQLPFKNVTITEAGYALLPALVVLNPGHKQYSSVKPFRSTTLINRQQDAVFHPPRCFQPL